MRATEDLQRIAEDLTNASESEIEKIIRHLTDPEVDYVFDLVNDIRIEQAKNPRLKFKTDREKQMKFIDNSHKISIALCGNQWGKSFAMAYKIVIVALGLDLDAPHQPDPTRPLEIVVVGPSWYKISETIQKDLFSLLRPDEYTTKSNGPYINKVVIKAPNGGETKILFMPSSSEKKQDSQEFEGSRYHYAFVDEGISPSLFQKILVRLGSQKGRFYQAFTRLPETLHLAHHLIDLEKGRGDFKHLIDLGWVQIIQAANVENKYLDEEEKLSMMAAAGTGDDLKLFKKYEPLMFLDDKESLDQKEEYLKQMTNEFKARILGIVDKPAGSVFNFREQVAGRDYNMFSFKEFAKVLMTEQLVWDLCHDYGQSAPATWLLVATSRNTGTMYIVDEVYARGMSIEQSAQECCKMVKRWKVYGKIRHIYADKQIRDSGRKDKRTDSGITIMSQYRNKVDADGDPCFPNNIQWICKQSDKNHKLHTIAVTSELIEQKNPFTGLPSIRISYKCGNTVKEFKMLRWDTKIHKQSGAEYEETEGDDHSIDPVRYMVNNKVNLALWEHRHKIQMEFNKMAFEVGGSANPLMLV